MLCYIYDLYWTYATNDRYHYQKIHFSLLRLLVRFSDLFENFEKKASVSVQSVTQLWTIFTAHKKSCVKPYNITCMFRWTCLYLVVDIFIKINSSGNWFPDPWNFGGQLQILHFHANHCPFQLPFHSTWKCTDWTAQMFENSAVFTFQMSSQLAASIPRPSCVISVIMTLLLVAQGDVT